MLSCSMLGWSLSFCMKWLRQRSLDPSADRLFSHRPVSRPDFFMPRSSSCRALSA